MSDIHEHLEHAEHEEHNISDPFNRKVAVSMAIVAAILAGVSMLGHRAHNDTLRLQTEAGKFRVLESDKWSQYQAKRMRQHVDQKLVPVVRLLPEGAASQAIREKVIEEMGQEIAKYKADLDETTNEANEFKHQAEEAQHEAHLSHERANWLDFGHLAAELGLILCSIALLTKKPEYWYSGLVSAGLSLGLVAAAFTVVH
jgi:Domain of unknown function (DUF4337)